MSNLIQHAQFELTRAGMFDSDADYGGVIAKSVMELIELFARQGHSGMSAGVTLALFQKLAAFEPLGAITSDPDEWIKVVDNDEAVGKPLWQNKRRSTSFSHDGGKTWYDIEDESLNNGATWVQKG